jgi:hypothetical protein
MERGAAYVLIGAYDPAAAPGGLRGLLPLAGTPLIEHQARRAVAAGAGRVLLLVDETPPELAAVVERLRADGIGTALCEGIDRIADALLPEDRVLLLADACLPDETQIRAALAQSSRAVTVLPDLPELAAFERIDAEARWGGLALVDGAHVAETAAMLGSWDPISTLLRRAVQQNAIRIPAGTAPILASDVSALAAAEQQMMAATRTRPDDWIGRAVFAPIEELALPLLLSRRIGTRAVSLIGSALALGGGALAWTGWRWAALILLLASGPVAAIAMRLARIRDQHDRSLAALTRLRPVAAAAGALGLTWLLYQASGQWGWWLVTAAMIAAILGRLPGSRAWLASSDTLIWSMLPGAIVGRWDIGLAVVAAYACASFVVVQWAALRGRGADAV